VLELLFNFVWLAISCTALLAWIRWRRESSSTEAPSMIRGLLVVICILALLFPAISISDDLSQTPGLAEGPRIQDTLKAPDVRAIDHLTIALVAPLLVRSSSRFWSVTEEPTIASHDRFWVPIIDKRPPPIG
jgi:hypothetical protein